MAKSLPYNPADPQSIREYAARLVGKTLRESIDLEEIDSPKRRRGSWGLAVEEFYFGYAPNSKSAADFTEAGIELKTTPIRRTAKNEFRAKERLVLSNINYSDVIREDFEHSHLLEKIANILLITYLWEEDKDPLDYEVMLADLWEIPPEDLPQIKRDWETVVSKIRAGKAHELSGSDTLYLEACTKGANAQDVTKQPYSDIPAKKRAWAFKASYMSSVQNSLLGKHKELERSEDEQEMSLLELVRKRFAPYFGMTQDELAKKFGLSNSKHLCARITNCILGIDPADKIDEFEKAGIKPRTMRLRKSGRPKEAAPYPAFDYFEVAEKDFEDSAFYEQLQQRYLFVLYRENDDGAYVLSDVCFWQMPDDDIDEARKCYEQMQSNIRQGRPDLSVKSSENYCCHVRPHARNSQDVAPAPYNKEAVKKSFWLNQDYLECVIREAVELYE